MKTLKIILLVILPLIMVGCAAPKREVTTKVKAFPKMYNEKPVSLLVVPIINNTTAADAADLYYTTLKPILSEYGYYVLPIQFTQQIMREQGIINGHIAKKVELRKYKTFFGADAVLFVTINAWDTDYNVFSSIMTVASKFSLYSTETKSKLWSGQSSRTFNLTAQSNNAIANLIITAIATATQDYFPIAMQVNNRVIHTLPRGVYNPYFEKDESQRIYNDFIPLEDDTVTLEAKKFLSPEPGFSNIYIYRYKDKWAQWSWLKKSIWVDEECLGTTAKGTFFKITVKTGADYLLETESETGRNKLKVNIKEDGNYFYKQVFSMGWSSPAVNLKNISEKQAKVEIKKLAMGKKSSCHK